MEERMVQVHSLPLRRAARLGAAIVVSAIALVAGLAPAGGATPAADRWTTVTFGPVSFLAPAAWPVYDLSSDPNRCVRLDRSAVYLGTQGRDARCPAHAVGHAPSVQVEALGARARLGSLGPERATASGLRYRTASGTAITRTVGAVFAPLGVRVSIRFAADLSLADRILDSFTANGAPAVPLRTSPAGASPARAGATTSASLQASGGAWYEGLGFDQCTAPSEAWMRAWLASPYRAIGIYVGGLNRGCAQPNLTPQWVGDVEAMGWNFIPTYVGLQAPCVMGQGMETIDPAKAAAQGKQEADDAAAQVAALGLGQGAPVYFDMEGYNVNDQSCAVTVKTFLSAWVGEMHVKHLTAGVYGGAASTMTQLVANYFDGSLHRPDDIWIAHWDGRQDVFGDPYVPDTMWPSHQRLHQYVGQHYETWGGVQIFVDNDVADGQLVGVRRNLAFAGHVSSPRDIYTVGVDRIGARRLTTSTADETSPAVSPDGTRIAYASKQGGNYNIWVMNADGSAKKQLTFASKFDGYPTWSPNGSQIAFQSTRTGHANIWIIGADGKGTRQLTATATANDSHPSWSPGGTSIAFQSTRSGNDDVWVIGTDRKGLRRLTWRSQADQDPAWSPSGKRIAFQSARTGNFEIFTIAPNGTGAKQVTNDPGSDTAPTWSKDSKRLAFVSTRSGTTQVWVMDVDGSNPIRVTGSGPQNAYPSWAT
jgi:hypothetical protein